MPTCFLILSEEINELNSESINAIRDIVAKELTSGARYLDRHHISVRTMKSRREHMLGDIEIEIHAQFFVRRFWKRDERARRISDRVASDFHISCATWINMSIVGYARVTTDGRAFFSDRASGRPP
jgi:hypothetical protein